MVGFCTLSKELAGLLGLSPSDEPVFGDFGLDVLLSSGVVRYQDLKDMDLITANKLAWVVLAGKDVKFRRLYQELLKFGGCR